MKGCFEGVEGVVDVTVELWMQALLDEHVVEALCLEQATRIELPRKEHLMHETFQKLAEEKTLVHFGQRVLKARVLFRI